MTIGRPKLKDKRVCSNCGSNTTYVRPKLGWPIWLRDKKGGWLCMWCHRKLILNPKWNPINHRKYNPRRITFRNKAYLMPENPRSGICSICGKPGGKRQTHMHHKEYHDEDMLKDTIELCASCHIKETIKKYNVRDLRWKTKL